MISFSKLGQFGRLGNQLFQYAFLRSTAERLKTKFYCPKWDGDDFFILGDETLRTSAMENIQHYYREGRQAGFCSDALKIGDHTEIEGFFQSEKYFSSSDHVLNWFRFRPEITKEVDKRFDKMSLDQCISFSLRIDDDYNDTREFFPLYSIRYYEKATALLNPFRSVLIFADRPDRAKVFFKKLSGLNLSFVEGLSGIQQLYLMTKCRDNVITNSTFAWWGAWLNKNPTKRIIAPRDWCRPGVPTPIADILCDDWIQIKGTRNILDHFQIWRLRHPLTTVRRIRKRLSLPFSHQK